jgi:hypothetical protein
MRIPLWITATENPKMFTFWVVLIFLNIGVIFVGILLKTTKVKKDKMES